MLSRIWKPSNATAVERAATPTAPSLLAPPKSPRALVNPFSLPVASDETRLEHTREERSSSWTACLVSGLPDINIVSPLGIARCIWSAKFDGHVSTFLDSNPSTPQHEGAKDWISLATAMRGISDAHKEVPMFRRPSGENSTLGLVTMPRASSTSASLSSRSSSMDCTSLKGILRTSSSSQPNLAAGSSFGMYEGTKARAGSAPSILFRLPVPSAAKRVRFGSLPGESPPSAQTFQHLAPPSSPRGKTSGLLKAKLPPTSSDTKTPDTSAAAKCPPTVQAVPRLRRARADASSIPLPLPETACASVAEESVGKKQYRAMHLEKSLPSAPPQIPEFLFLFGDRFQFADDVSDSVSPAPVKIEPPQSSPPKDPTFIESWAAEVTSGGSKPTLAEERVTIRASLAMYQIACPRPDPQVLRMQQRFNPLPTEGAETPGATARRPPPLPPRTPDLPGHASDSSDSSSDDGVALSEASMVSLPESRSTSTAPVLPPFEFGVSRKSAVSYKEAPIVGPRTMRLVPSNGPLIPPLAFDPYGCSVDFKAYMSSKTELPPLPQD